MSFTLERITAQGVRVGWLAKVLEGQNIIMETPLCLPHTRGGFFPFMTPDIVEKLSHKPPAAMLTMATMYDSPGSTVLSQYGKGIHKFLSVEGSLLYMSVQDPITQPAPSYNDTKSVSVWNSGGRSKVTVDDHMSLVESFRPDMFEALCDTASSCNHRPKRIGKSVDRTLTFLDQSLEFKEKSDKLKDCKIMGAIGGSDLLEERVRSAKETALRPVDGFVIEGFQLDYNEEAFQDIITAAVNELPSEKLRIIHGLYKPSDIFKALECGIDIFDSSHTLRATENGRALTFPIQLPEPAAGDSDSSPPLPNVVFDIDLNDSQYAQYFQPLLAGCSCYTCANYTCAYIHHLLNVKELLASILLMVHNVSHLMTFFENLRKAINNNKYIEFKSACTTKS